MDRPRAAQRPVHPDQLDGQTRFRADLVADLDSLFLHELRQLREVVAEQLAAKRRAGTVAERRVAETLRAWAACRDPAQHRPWEDPAAGRPPGPHKWPDQKRGRWREDR